MPTDPDFVPSTVKAAVDHIVANLSEEREFIRAQEAHAAHFGGGMSLRNDWSLWEPETPLKRDAVKTYGIAHADDISGLIMEWVWANVRGYPFDPIRACSRFHDHWRRAGTTALKAGGYSEDGNYAESQV